MDKNYQKQLMEQQRKDALKKKQEEEASRLEQLQREQEERMAQQMYTPTTNYYGQPQFVMPGVAVQPNYQIVSPYAGNHNYQAVPVMYDPTMYGIEYEKAPTGIQNPAQNSFEANAYGTGAEGRDFNMTAQPLNDS
jgi:hypothetical protein